MIFNLAPYLIGIGGLSGSGKTALAGRLASHLGDCSVVALDSYYLPQGHLPMPARSALNFDHPDALDWALLERHLTSLAAGEAFEEPAYSFAEHTRIPSSRRVEPAAFVILEGILVLHRPEIRTLLQRAVYVETEPEVCLQRRIERDITERGRTRDSVLTQYEATVWPMALTYVLPSREHADVLVSGEAPFHETVATVLESIQRTQRAPMGGL